MKKDKNTEKQELITEVPTDVVEDSQELITEVQDEDESPKKRGRGRPKKPKEEVEAASKRKEVLGNVTPKAIKLIKGNYSKRTLKARFGISL